MPFVNLADFKERELVPGFRVRFVHSEHMTFAYWTIRAGAALPLHSHPHEQVATITKGRLEMTIEGENRFLEPGVVAVIPPNARHSGTALTDSEIVDAFYPVREDYR